VTGKSSLKEDQPSRGIETPTVGISGDALVALKRINPVEGLKHLAAQHHPL